MEAMKTNAENHCNVHIYCMVGLVLSLGPHRPFLLYIVTLMEILSLYRGCNIVAIHIIGICSIIMHLCIFAA